MLKVSFKRLVPLTVLTAVMALAPIGAVSAATVAGDSNLVLTSPMRQDSEPVTIYGLGSGPVPSFDPQAASDEVSISPIENLFLGIADVDPATAKLRPELAAESDSVPGQIGDVNEAGDTWTFKIRNDVPWVRWDPSTQTATEVRKVTAGDIVYGMKRICDPRLGAAYMGVAASIVKGCDVVSKIDPAQITEADFDQIEVSAPDDTTLVVTTQGSLGFFQSTLSFWFFRPVPKETVDEFGDKWTDVGNIVTNGPYVIDQYDPNVNRVYVKNPLYVDVNDSYGGNVERIFQIEVADATTGYSLYLNNQIDAVGVPRAELPNVRGDAELSQQLRQTISLSTFYFAFAQDKAPFDKVEARRAFSAAVDRNLFVSEIVDVSRGIPIAHFMPPGILGAVPLNEVGLGTADNLGFDPEFGKAQLEAAGYPNCEGFPDITIAVYQGAEPWAEFLQNAVSTNYGCDASKMSIEALDFGVLLEAVRKDKPTAERPNMWTLGWGADYPDGQNWMHDVLSCNVDNPFARECDATDELIDAAGKETDGSKRVEMYRQIEEQFFGPEGSFPIIPLYIRTTPSLVKPWYTGFFDTDALFGGPHWNSRKIDQEAQLAARGGANVLPVAPTPAQ
ncbi:MAG: peptide ABC transporter substrate-binding protein [Anaerolineae bacterium]|nr:peptide ABC transporter substrate-binding protein [Anaerolineae bacterium]